MATAVKRLTATRQVLGQQLKAERRRQGLSQSALAGRAGLSAYAISVGESGGHLAPAQLRQWAEALNVDLAQWGPVPVEATSRMDPICRYLKAERERQGLRQADVAGRAGWSQAGLSKAETGRRPRNDTILRWAEALDVDLRAAGLSLDRDPHERLSTDPLLAHLRAERERQGLRQCDLAGKSGLAPSVISHAESGHNWPDLGTVHLMAEALGVDLAPWGVPTPESVGDLIRAERCKRGLTQDQFADETGVSRATVVNWESGRYRPGLYTWRQAEAALLRHDEPADQHTLEDDDSLCA